MRAFEVNVLSHLHTVSVIYKSLDGDVDGS